jgi:FdhE protein
MSSDRGMRDDYDRRIARATELTAALPESAELLEFYAEAVRFQKVVFERLHFTGETELRILAQFFPRLLNLLERSGTVQMKTYARQSPDGGEELISRYWDGDRSATPEEQFFARVLLQPYAEYLASRGKPDAQSTGPVCPFCGEKPVVGVLRAEGEGAKRSLICSLCATEWPFRRVVCPYCGEENKDKLPIFIAEQAEHVRLDACDSCGSYFKSVDLTRNGHAVPIVDELATVALSIWANERGYAKAQPNLLGM